MEGSNNESPRLYIGINTYMYYEYIQIYLLLLMLLCLAELSVLVCSGWQWPFFTFCGDYTLFGMTFNVRDRGYGSAAL